MNTLLQDVRYGLRLLRKSPGFTAVGILSLALGIGANTTIFTLLNAVFLQPLPVKDLGSLVSVFTTDAKNTGRFLDFMPMSNPNYRDYREQCDAFSDLIATSGVPVSVMGGKGDPELAFGMLVTGNYFDALGVRFTHGRGFLAEEDSTPGGHPVAILSDGFWRRRFGGDDSLLGKTLSLSGKTYTVVGIAPAGFKGTQAFGGPDLWIPVAQHADFLPRDEWYESRRALLFNVLGRLKPGVKLEQATASMKAIAARLEKEYPDDNLKRSINLVPLAQSLIDPNQRGLFLNAGGLLMTVVGLVLLIASANLANLLLARASARRKEVAIRLSLGAGRWRLVRQLLTESLLLSLMGGAAGLALAAWGRDLLWRFRPPFLGPNDLNLALDGRVLLFTLLLSIATGVLFGLAPAIRSSRPDLALDLKERTTLAGHHIRRFSARNLLVMSQVALSLVALVGSGLFLRSLFAAQRIDPGFDAEKLVVISMDVAGQGYDQPRGEEYYRQMLERVASVPGVEAASLATNQPFGGGFMRSVFPEGLDGNTERSGILVMMDTISPGHLKAAGIPLVRGRDFSSVDREGAPPVVIVNETMAKKFWPNEDAVGKRFHFHGEPQVWNEVVGIARDSKYITLGEDPMPMMYVAVNQHYESARTLFVRSSGDPDRLVGLVRPQVQALDKNLPLTNVGTVRERMAQALWAARMGAGLLAIFGALAVILAAMGIYGVLMYSVSQRTQEIGIRMAMGARPGDVLSLVLRQGMVPVLLGMALGLAASAGLTRLVSGLVTGVGAFDPVTFIGVSLLLTVVALVASWVPARRAARVDPLIALRSE
jgi:predicted permease